MRVQQVICLEFRKAKGALVVVRFCRRRFVAFLVARQHEADFGLVVAQLTLECLVILVELGHVVAVAAV